MTRLCDLVEQVLAQNQEMNLRLRNIDNAVISQVGSAEPEGGRDASVTSSREATPPRGPPKDDPGVVQRNNIGFAFEEDLLSSRVYRKPLFSESGQYQSMLMRLATALATALGTFNQIVWLLNTRKELVFLFSRLQKPGKGMDLPMYSSGGGSKRQSHTLYQNQN